jgi:predicted acetyltransferase
MSQWWIKKNTGYEVNEYLEPGLRYTEEIGYTVHSVPVRYCCLWLESEEGPISDLEVLSFKQRFGAVSVPAEGIGGVETLPKFRRQGYMTKLLTKTVEGMARRVDVAFVSEAIEGVYEKFGFVPCLADAHLLLKVRHIERLLNNNAEITDRQNLREFTPDDRPRMVSLYNEAHAHRPWTHERHPGWDRLVKQEIWAPGSEVLVLEESENLVGYAILEGQRFGRESSVFIVDEFTAKDSQAAAAS